MRTKRRIIAVAMVLGMLLLQVSPSLAVPPLPSSFYGTVKIDGENVTAGTQVSAWINGVQYAYTTVQTFEGDTVFALDVPGDEQETTGTVEGGQQGDTIVFRVGGYVADETATWQTGTNVSRNLSLWTPTDITLSSSSVEENQPSGTSVGTFGTTDPSVGDEHTYALVAGAGAADNASFTIDGAVLKTAATFDYETKASYQIRVRTTDHSGLSFEKAFIVTIEDVNEAPVLAPIGNKSVGQGEALTFTATATDEDGDPLTFSLSGSSVPAGASIGASSGAFSWSVPQGQVPGNYTFDVCVSDGELSDCETITVTVEQRVIPITVTAHPQTKVYGDADPVLTYTSSDPAVVFSGTLNRAPGASVGIYAINQGTLSAGPDYAITFVPANLIITAKPIAVTADAKSKVYGEADPALTYQVTPALVAGDSFTGTPVRDAGEDVGAYAINEGSLSAGDNYTMIFLTADLTITERPITVRADDKEKAVGDADPALTHSITAGSLAFSDSFTGALVRDPGEGLGTYAIRQGTLALGSNYALTFDEGTFTIKANAITVTAHAKSKVYGDADPALTYTSSDATVVFTGALGRVAGEDVGTYAINQGTLSAGPDYAITFVPADLTITAKPITVTADAKSKAYGDADPALTYQVAPAMVPGDSLTGSLARVAGENVGAYAITIGTLSADANYAVTFVPGNLTITKRPITVRADDAEKAVGDADPALTHSITAGSLAFSDVFTGALVRDAGEALGTYAIRQGTLALSSNYDLTFVEGTFTIKALAITVTADAKSKVYGGPDPALTYTCSDPTVTFTGALSREAGEDVGTYAIKQGTLSAGPNYAITLVPANLTITPKPVTVTADAQSKVVGEVDPALTYQVAPALVAGDSFTGTPVRDAGEGVGTYVIRQGTLALSSNYHMTFIEGLFTIEGADYRIFLPLVRR